MLKGTGQVNRKAEPAVFNRDDHALAAVSREFDRQQHRIGLIASENIASGAVLAAQGSVLTDKYGEGHPKRRYRGGYEFIDKAFAIKGAKLLLVRILRTRSRTHVPTQIRGVQS